MNKLFIKIALVVLWAFLFGHTISYASSYHSEEILFIEWGDNTSQLKISPEVRETGVTLDDSTDDVTFPGNGPDYGFVDRNENAYFSSYGFLQLKAFRPSGDVIFDYSVEQPGYRSEFFVAGVGKIYVDSLSRIYITGGPEQSYVAVADTSGNFLAALNPYGPNSQTKISTIYFNSNDVITLRLMEGTSHTYAAGIFITGGCSAWKAKDGSYYTAFERDSTVISVEKLENPDLSGSATVVMENTYDYSGPFIRYSQFLGVDDQMVLYLFMVESHPESWKVIIFNQALEKTDEVVIPIAVNRFNRVMDPFMRPKDGNIYEFRCLDDGLHVIRWSKQ
jgi:hypothetical protein